MVLVAVFSPAVARSAGTNADTVDGYHAISFAMATQTYTKAQVDSLVSGLQSQIAALQYILQTFSRSGNEITISGANLHIVSGAGSTNAPVNGLGNLVVGYNESRGPGSDIRTGSHNIVVGGGQNYASYAGLLAGYMNSISGPYCSVTGGIANVASGNYSAVAGGELNTASGERSAVSGGTMNTAQGVDSTVGGGGENGASGAASWVGGGRMNTAGYYAAVAGGIQNSAQGQFSSILGGQYNQTHATYSSVGGGNGNDTVGGYWSTIGGGFQRTVSGDSDWAAGSLWQDQ